MKRAYYNAGHIRMTDLEGAPRAHEGTLLAFFRQMEQHPPKNRWVGELYLSWHRGTYTTMHKTKQLLRRAERGIHDVEALLATCPDIDTIILACTHYTLIYHKISAAVPRHIDIVCQGPIVAESLADYLRRHPEMQTRLSTGGSIKFETTENPEKFNPLASLFTGSEVNASHITL